MPEWYSCLHCSPHGLAEHSMYGDRKCLIEGCPCNGYEKDEKNQQKRPGKKKAHFNVLRLPSALNPK
jgi:hypothetical protein